MSVREFCDAPVDVAPGAFDDAVTATVEAALDAPGFGAEVYGGGEQASGAEGTSNEALDAAFDLAFLDTSGPVRPSAPHVAAPPGVGAPVSASDAAQALVDLPVLDGTVPDGIRDILLAMGGDFADMVSAYRPEGTTLAAVEEVPFEPPRPEAQIDAPTEAEDPEEPALVADIRDLEVFLSPMGEGTHRTLEHLLTHMAKVRATDLHLIIGQPPAFRIGGEVRRLDHEALNATHMDTFLYAILTSEDHARMQALSKRAAEAVQMVGVDVMHEIDVVYAHAGNRYRCNVAMEQQGPMLSIRILPSKPPAIEGLNLPVGINRLFDLASGLVLIAGPTGGGKTTTLAAIVGEIARRRADNIVSIEEPIEYQYPRNLRAIIRQREVGRHTHSFASGVRAALRQDPDVIVVGEILDAETMNYALAAARTGHLVLATIHANSAADVPQRVVDMFPANNRPVVASQLSGVLEFMTFQQLLPRTNRTDMVPAYEVVPVTSAIRSNIDEMQWMEIKEACRNAATQKGGVTLMESIRRLTESGEVEARIAMSILTPDERAQFERGMRL